MGITKKANRVNKKEQKEYEARLQEFHAEYKKLSDKYQVDMTARLIYNNNSIVAGFDFVNLKENGKETKKSRK